MVAVPQCTLANEWHYIFVIASFASRLFGPTCFVIARSGPRWAASPSGALNMAPRREFSDFTRAVP
jgi:hypothetical protein